MRSRALQVKRVLLWLQPRTCSLSAHLLRRLASTLQANFLVHPTLYPYRLRLHEF